ncbi:flagellum-specific ATP synthase [Steroidobacter denitrificans]|uniref:Flagellum-specific ATP synthase n=1 Tax=Steroidobacter denitrificans TaxID=465721 RepID=A0A127FAF0_STEDE|nr:flagellar protein export ATPase FliI [Steroidobacter denitrificans]AMN46601.1 flagellum-specific ATP synthase [Steroidobacter denitrificans]
MNVPGAHERGLHEASQAHSAGPAQWTRHLTRCAALLERLPPPPVEGVLTRMVGLTLEAAGCQAAVGDRCDVLAGAGERIEAEVVGFSGDRLYLMPTGDIHGLKPNARVIPRLGAEMAAVGPQLLGRIVDGAGTPLDGLGPLSCPARVRLTGVPINPLSRQPIEEPLDVGIRSINALLTVGRGQRIGLFAGSGVGKSVLLGMMARYTSADVIVVGLIGERGREVKEFVERILGPKGLERAVVVATPADNPPLMRLHGAWRATAIAEYFRDQGKNVLLIMDSLTRFAQAQREIGLAIGEAPATKGYPPSVFARLPQLVERAGNGASGHGSITAFYTVLTEGDDQQDPIADSARAILDGHVVLSRRIAESGQYPAIDIEASISRVMHDIVPSRHTAMARRFKQALSLFQQNRDLIAIGAYNAGSDPRIDAAIALWPQMQQFLRQDVEDSVDFERSIQELAALVAETGETSGETQ